MQKKIIAVLLALAAILAVGCSKGQTEEVVTIEPPASTRDPRRGDHAYRSAHGGAHAGTLHLPLYR